MVKLKKPFRAVNDNVVLAGATAWAYYKVPAKSISDSATEELEDYKRTFGNTLVELGKHNEIDLHLVPIDMKLDERFSELSKDYDAELRDVAQYYEDRVKSILKSELGDVTQYNFVIGVKLSNRGYKASRGFWQSIVDAIDHATDTAFDYLGMQLPMTDKVFEQFVMNEQDVFTSLGALLPERLTTDETYAYTLAPFSRGMVEKDTSKTLKVTNTVLDSVSDSGYLRMQDEAGESVTAFMPIVETSLNTTYLELFKQVQRMPFPVEFKVKLVKLSSSKASSKTMFTARRFKETDKDMYANEDADDVIVNGKQLLTDLRNEIQNEQTPLYQWVGVFIISAPDKETVRDREKVLQSWLSSYNVKVARPFDAQLELFYTMLNGASVAYDKFWLQYMTHEGVAELSYGLSDRVGNNIGFYLGRVLNGVYNNIQDAIYNSRAVVLIHPFLANEGIKGAITDSPHMSITGETGKGKTFLANILMFFSMMIGVAFLAFDPKTEKKAWFDAALSNTQNPFFRKLLKSIHYVVLDPDDEANHGVIDPILFLTGSQAKDTVVSMIETVYDMRKKDDVKREILEYTDVLLEQRAKGEKVGLMMLVDHLEAHSVQTIREAGGLLRQQVKNSLLQLAFSDGTNDGLNIEHKYTVLSVKGLDLPDADLSFDELSDRDRKALALMLPIAKFAQYFGTRDRHQKTATFFDEAWTLTKTAQGRRMLKELRRVGRSMNNQLVLITQSVKDLSNEDDTGNFGMNFAFDERSEREDILKMLDLPATKQNIEGLSGLLKGQAYYRDIYGRVAKISIDTPFEEWAEAFKTVDKTNSASAEEKYA